MATPPASPRASVRRPRRTDPDRRDRIVDACIETIAAVGVAGASARKVAECADVSLGSITYYFESMDELVREAFSRFSDTVADRFTERMAAVVDDDRRGAANAVIELISHDVLSTRNDLVLTHELYTLAARDESFRPITDRWMRRSRAALERCFEPQTARLLDALIEGLTIHRALGGDGELEAVADAQLAVRRIIGAA